VARALPSRSRQGRAGPGPGIRKAPLPSPAAALRLYTADGARKYVTAGERDAFLREAERADRLVRTLCMTLAYAGSRLSEALALTADRVDLAAGMLVFETLKKRQSGIYRAVPVPPALLDALDLVQGIRELHARRGAADSGAAMQAGSFLPITVKSPRRSCRRLIGKTLATPGERCHPNTGLRL
jgi:integrase